MPLVRKAARKSGGHALWQRRTPNPYRDEGWQFREPPPPPSQGKEARRILPKRALPHGPGVGVLGSGARPSSGVEESVAASMGVLKADTFRTYLFNANAVYALLALLQDDAMVTQVQQDFERWARVVQGMDFEQFRATWRSARQLVPLQSRLVLEQVLWFLGDPWRSLVTGFRPLGDDE